VIVITTYFFISLLLLYLPLLPDLKILLRFKEKTGKKLNWLYRFQGSFWKGSPSQFRISDRAINILCIIIIPVAFCIHTVTSWLFATTYRPGWDSTNFGAYFVSGAFLVGAGWLAHAQLGLFEISDSEAAPKPPAFVEDARHAHETALIRARMVSQHERPDYNPAEILAETGIAIPALATDWRVVDAQVFPSRFGHSVELVLQADALGRVSGAAPIVCSPKFHG